MNHYLTACVSAVAASLLAAAPARAAAFHVDPAGSDAAAGTSPATAWKTVARANQAKPNPGDSLLFKCGGVWAGQLNLAASGSEGKYITLTAYWEGPLPAFENPDNASAYAINLSGDWIEVSRVQVRKVFLQGINVGTGSEHTLFRGVEVYQCGLGIYISGRYARVTGSYFHDLNTMVNTPGGNDDNGAVGVVMANSDMEVDHNRFEKCIGPSFDYGYDGGAVEIWAERDIRNVSIHHNRIRRCCGFFEIGGLGFAVEGVRVAYNQMEDCFGLSFLLFNNSGDYTIKLKDYRFENNTVVVHDCPGERVWTCIAFVIPSEPGVPAMRNNLFYVFNADRIFDKATSPLTENNLVFHGGAAWFDKNFTASPSDIIGKDPLFEDPGTCAATGDYRLKPGSPALAAGLDLGYGEDLEGKPLAAGAKPAIGAYGAAATVAINKKGRLMPASNQTRAVPSDALGRKVKAISGGGRTRSGIPRQRPCIPSGDGS